MYDTESESQYPPQTLADDDVGSSIETNVALWWGMLVSGEAALVCGQGAHGKSLHFPLNFSVNLKVF